jgi:hypothetical protein
MSLQPWSATERGARPPSPRGLPQLWYAVALVFACGVVFTTGAYAQFGTTDRQFHNQTSFPLEGQHRAVACESCHLSGVYKGTPNKCFDCHWVRRQDDRFKLQLGTQCEQCHRPVAWTAVQWNHGTMTAMPLNAAHQQLSCQSCHKGDSFRSSETSCFACHQRDFQTAQTPNHVAAGFPTTCEACHAPSATTFRGAMFDHNSSFPLIGAHALETCVSCHRTNVFKGTPRDCVGCHRDSYTRTTTPNHAAAGFPTTCETCHRPTDASWRGVGFNHNAVFALVGTHAQQTCATCHVNNVLKGTPRDCVGCHRDAYTRTTAPNHAAAGFPTTCETCHRATDTSWRGATFNHSTVFALVGRHAQVACATCHVNNVFKGTARDCVGCHRNNYTRTTSPSHTAAGFPTTCESCHRATDTSWTQGTFTHRFPITSGPHRTSCATCHTNTSSYQVFTCLTCHEHDRTRMDDKHRGRSGYRYDSLACYSCHQNGRS